MTYRAYRDSQRLASEESFEAIIMAVMRQADDILLPVLQMKHPEIWKELKERYNAPGGKLEGEV